MKRTPLVTTTIAAYAAFVPLKVLRAWLDDGRFELTVSPDHALNKWRRVAALDILRIAATHRLLRYGFLLRETAAILDDVLGKVLTDAGRSPDVTLPQLVEALADYGAVVVREPNGSVRVRAVTPNGPSMGQLEAAGLEHFLFIDLGVIAQHCAARLAVALAAGEAGERLADLVDAP